jgi:ligand-binding SRPBCC domain-containing protein
MDRFELSTRLPATAERVWDHVTSIDGIKFEMAPWLTMTVPRGLDASEFGERFRNGTLPMPAALGRSWVLLFGVVPFDWDDMVLVELEGGRRFLERSSMLSLRVWEHERIVSPDGDGSLVTDRLAWETRGRMMKPLAFRIVRAIFSHRHRRLIERFGGVNGQNLG